MGFVVIAKAFAPQATIYKDLMVSSLPFISLNMMDNLIRNSTLF